MPIKYANEAAYYFMAALGLPNQDGFNTWNPSLLDLPARLFRLRPG